MDVNFVDLRGFTVYVDLVNDVIVLSFTILTDSDHFDLDITSIVVPYLCFYSSFELSN